MNQTRFIFIVFIAIAGLIIWKITANVETNTEDAAGGSFFSSTPVKLSIASSSTKKNWLDQMVAQFNDDKRTTDDGHVVHLTVTHVTSGGSMNDILEGKLKPVIWSPGDRSWIAQLNDAWRQRNRQNISSNDCVPTVYAPLGFAMWRPMAETLGWPAKKIGWDTITELAAAPEGWAKYGRPDWGQFRFGHTHPAYANSGLLSMTAFVYGIVGNDKPLTVKDVYSAEAAMRTLANNTTKYGSQTSALLELMAKHGASYLHAAAIPEANVLKFNNDRGSELQFPLVFIFPTGGTMWADHPYCILDNAEWVSTKQQQAAIIFRDYLLAKEQQAIAIDNYLRPLDTSVLLHAPISLENGTDPTVTPETIKALPSPSSEIGQAVIDLFLSTKRKSTVMILLDTSGSMQGNKIRTATQATSSFLKRLHPDDTIGVLTFSDDINELMKPARVGDVVEQLSERILTTIAKGNTNLHGGVCEAHKLIKEIRKQDIDDKNRKLYGIILLSDGDDTTGRISANKMFSMCLPSNPEANGVKIFPIAFGDKANSLLLSRIADVSGGRMFLAKPESIEKIYLKISAEQ